MRARLQITLKSGDSIVDERFRIIAMVERGAFIVLEGLDRSGKTTQATKLVQRIKGMDKPCTLMKFPGKHLHSLSAEPDCMFVDRTTMIGKMIDAYLQNTENLDDHAVHLLFSANRWEARLLSIFAVN
jgi:dTMP kinase